MYSFIAKNKKNYIKLMGKNQFEIKPCKSLLNYKGHNLTNQEVAQVQPIISI